MKGFLMNYKLLIPMLICLGSTLFANGYNQQNNSAPANAEPAINTQNSQPEIWNFRPDNQEAWWKISATLLYWKPYEGALDYVISGTQPNFVPGQADQGAIGDLKSAELNFCPGYRLNLAYTLFPDRWGLEGIYTYFYSSGNDSEKSPISGTFDQKTGPEFLSARSHIRLNYNVAELMLTSFWTLRKNVLGSLQGGVVGAWVHQHWNFKYNGITGINKYHHSWEFDGAGLKAALGLDWYIDYGFSFLTKIGLASIYGNYQSQNKGTVKELANNNDYILINIRNHDHRFSFSPQFFLGLVWGKIFDNWGLSLSLGYESQIWLNLQEIYSSFLETDPRDGKVVLLKRGALGLHGLNAMVELLF